MAWMDHLRGYLTPFFRKRDSFRSIVLKWLDRFHQSPGPDMLHPAKLRLQEGARWALSNKISSQRAQGFAIGFVITDMCRSTNTHTLTHTSRKKLCWTHRQIRSSTYNLYMFIFLYMLCLDWSFQWGWHYPEHNGWITPINCSSV